MRGEVFRVDFEERAAFRSENLLIGTPPRMTGRVTGLSTGSASNPSDTALSFRTSLLKTQCNR